MPISLSNKKIIGLTAGDAAGIGPEITLKALGKIKSKNTRYLIIGDSSVFEDLKKRFRSKKIKVPSYEVINKVDCLASCKSDIVLLNLGVIGKRRFALGKTSKICGKASYEYIKRGVRLANKKIIDGLVTAPINKEALCRAGHKWPGHTELIAHLTNTKNFAMMFVAEHIKTTLVTTHVQLKKVSSKLKTGDILNKIELTYDFLKKSFNIKNPLIGVCGLNPHASEQGLFGGEEQKIISPAVKQAKKKKIRTIGPESAESLFYKMYNKQIDAVISMYHDQALIAVKMVLRDKAVNLTLGLPFIRTSASSGTAYDIAGRLEASSLSMEEAIKLADNLIKPKKG